MTYEEIIQALRYCKFGVPCEKCPVVGNEDCFDEVNTAAADLIERLTAENAALREKQRWIPVTERMPEPETDVLAVCNRNGYIFVTPAIYEDGKLLTQESAWNWSDIYCYACTTRRRMITTSRRVGGRTDSLIRTMCTTIR